MKLQENLENQIFKAGAARMRSHGSVFTDEGRRGLSDHLHLALSLCILRSWGGRGIELTHCRLQLWQLGNSAAAYKVESKDESIL